MFHTLARDHACQAQTGICCLNPDSYLGRYFRIPDHFAFATASCHGPTIIIAKFGLFDSSSQVSASKFEDRIGAVGFEARHPNL